MAEPMDEGAVRRLVGATPRPAADKKKRLIVKLPPPSDPSSACGSSLMAKLRSNSDTAAERSADEAKWGLQPPTAPSRG